MRSAARGYNYLMADDHAKWFRTTAISPGSFNRTSGDGGALDGSGISTCANTSCSGVSATVCLQQMAAVL